MVVKTPGFLKRGLFQRVSAIVNNPRVVLGLWVLLALITTYKQYFLNRYNNYLIFKYVYYHASEAKNLYSYYAGQYEDLNHYGPFFSVLIAPFALMPDWFGLLLWQLSNTLFLFFAISQLPVSKKAIIIIYWIITHELLTAMFGFQFNSSIAAIVVMAYVLIERKQNFWAAFLILLGTFVKLYGIVGLAFFFFAKQKQRFVLYCLFWTIVFFALPMLFFSPHFIIDSYREWYFSLAGKQMVNASLTSWQDISVMGMARRFTQNASLPDLPFLAAGVLIFVLPYIRVQEYKSPLFRLMYLAATLIFVVIFSNSSESPTYIIAFVGVAIWFVARKKPVKPINIALLIFALLLTSLSPSDLFPRFIRDTYIRPYSLKALPCVLIWIAISYELLFRKFYIEEEEYAG